MEFSRETEGTFAATVWILAGIYLFWNDRVSILTLQGAVYFVIGSLVATYAFGAAIYVFQQIMTKALAVAIRRQSGFAAGTNWLIGLAVMAVGAVIIFMIARWTFEALLY